MKFSISTNTRSVVHMSAAREADIKPSDDIEIAVNVKIAQYVPKGVTLRARLDDHMFTAVTSVSNLDNLEQDPCIASVQVGQKVHGIELGK